MQPNVRTPRVERIVNAGVLKRALKRIRDSPADARMAFLKRSAAVTV